MLSVWPLLTMTFVTLVFGFHTPDELEGVRLLFIIKLQGVVREV